MHVVITHPELDGVGRVQLVTVDSHSSIQRARSRRREWGNKALTRDPFGNHSSCHKMLFHRQWNNWSNDMWTGSRTNVQLQWKGRPLFHAVRTRVFVV